MMTSRMLFREQPSVQQQVDCFFFCWGSTGCSLGTCKIHFLKLYFFKILQTFAFGVRRFSPLKIDDCHFLLP